MSDETAYAALAKEFGDQPEVKMEAPETPPAPAPVPAPLAPEVVEERYNNLRGAVKEAREENRQLKETVGRMQQLYAQIVQGQKKAEEPPPPAIEDDPVKYFQHQNEELRRTVEELRHGQTQTVEQQRQALEQRNWAQEVARQESEFAVKMPDYGAAAAFLEQGRRTELGYMFPDNEVNSQAARQRGFPSVAAMREAILNNDRIVVAQNAMQQGINPAQAYYELAKVRGYRAGTTPAPSAGTPDKAAMIEKGMKASGTISGGGVGPSADTVDRLTELYAEDPAKADQMFARMKKAGKL
jgi:hypothetical protein